MKKVLFIFLSTLMVTAVWAQVKITSILPPEKIATFSRKKLNVKTDLLETVKVVEHLLAVDDVEPSRVDVLALSESYNKNKNVYNQAFIIVEKNKSKVQRMNLKEIKKLLSDAYNNGNG